MFSCLFFFQARFLEFSDICCLLGALEIQNRKASNIGVDGVKAKFLFFSETDRKCFRRGRFQSPSSVSFLALAEFQGPNSVSSSQPIMCVCASANSLSFLQNSPSLPKSSVSFLFQSNTLRTVFHWFAIFEEFLNEAQSTATVKENAEKTEVSQKEKHERNVNTTKKRQKTKRKRNTNPN